MPVLAIVRLPPVVLLLLVVLLLATPPSCKWAVLPSAADTPPSCRWAVPRSEVWLVPRPTGLAVTEGAVVPVLEVVPVEAVVLFTPPSCMSAVPLSDVWLVPGPTGLAVTDGATALEVASVEVVPLVTPPDVSSESGGGPPAFASRFSACMMRSVMLAICDESMAVSQAVGSGVAW